MVPQTSTVSPPIEWTDPLHQVGPTDKPWAKLLGTVTIAGIDHHIEAYAIHIVPGHGATCTTEGCEHDFDEHCEDVDVYPDMNMETHRGECHLCSCQMFTAPPDGGYQEPVSPEVCNFNELSEIAQGPMQTVTIDEHDYVFLVTPFQS